MALLLFDYFFHVRRAHVPSLEEAARWSAALVGVALLFGVAVVAFYVTAFADPAVQWKALLEPALSGFFEAQEFDAATRAALVEGMAQWMTGTLAAAYFLQLVASLLLARWWQPLLYNPGGFRQEFHALRLSRALAVVAVPLFAGLFFAGLPELLRYLALPVAAAFFLQGLALAHGQLAAFNATQDLPGERSLSNSAAILRHMGPEAPAGLRSGGCAAPG